MKKKFQSFLFLRQGDAESNRLYALNKRHSGTAVIKKCGPRLGPAVNSAGTIHTYTSSRLFPRGITRDN